MKLFDSEGVALVNMLQGGSAALKAYAAEAASLGILLDSSMVKGVEAANDASNRLSKSFSVIATTINVVLAPYIVYLSNLMVELVKTFRSSTGMMISFDGVVRVVAQSFIVSFQAMSTAVSGYTSVYLYLKTAVLNTIGETERATASWAAFNDSIKTGEERFLTLANSINGNSPVLNKFLADIAKIEFGFADVEVAGSKAMKGINDSLVDTDKLAKKAESTVGSGLTGAFRQSLDGANTWGDALSGILKDLIAQMFQMYVVQQLLGGLGLGGTTTTGATTAGVVVAGAGATGGTVGKTGSYLVGEKGAEIVTLNGGANITPNHDIGGGGTTVNVYNNTNSQVDVQEDEAGKIDIIISTIANQITTGAGILGTSFENRYNLSKA